MPIFITQGRYTREAIKGMIVKPEDRYEALARHVARAGGRVMSYYLTFGDYDFLTVIEAPSETQMAALLLSAAATGGVGKRSAHHTCVDAIEAKGAFAAASDLAPSYRAPGGTETSAVSPHPSPFAGMVNAGRVGGTLIVPVILLAGCGEFSTAFFP